MLDRARKVAIQRLWDLDGICDDREVRKAALELQAWLARQSDGLANHLAGVGEYVPPKNTMLHELERRIARHFTPRSKAVACLEALAVVVDRGNEKGIFHLCPPRIPLHLRPEKSPFQREYMASLSRVRLWRDKVFLTTIDDPAAHPDAYIGQVLASAVLNGALLYTGHVGALYSQLGEPLQLVRLDGEGASTHTFLELRLTFGPHDVPELRRWFPDPFTEMLLLRLPPALTSACGKGSKRERQQRAWRRILAFFRFVGLEREELPTSLAAFLKAAIFEQRLRLPGFLVSYAARDIVAHSLKPYVWKRLFGLLETGRQVGEADEVKRSKERRIPDAEEARKDQVLEFRWAKVLRRLLRGEDRSRIKKDVAATIRQAKKSEYSLPVICLRWIEFMLTRGSASGNRLEISTIRDYAGQIPSRIAGYVGDVDLTMLEGDGLMEIYEQILMDVKSPSYRHKIARGLREFHHFLVSEYQVAPIDYREVLGVGVYQSAVDANLISIDEYYRTLDELDMMQPQLSPQTQLLDIVKLVFILAFRCGLRRMEVLKLRIDDVHDCEPMELLVRKNDLRKLKTKSSTRKLPLSVLLTPEECQRLREWKRSREKQAAGDRADRGFLFALPGSGQPFVSEDRVFDAIRTAMHRATGDASLRFHHLRHSMASWFMIALVLADLGVDADIFSHLPRTVEWLRRAQALREGLYGNGHPTRRHLYAIASLLGHSGPDISSGSYIHLYDVALKLVLDRRAVMCDRAALVRASGLPRSTAQRLFQRKGLEGMLEAVRDRASAVRLVRNLTVEAPSFPADDWDDLMGPEVRMMERVWSCLMLRDCREVDYEVLAERYGIEEEWILRYENRAKKIAKKTPRSQKGRRHPPEKAGWGRCVPEFCPRRPKTKGAWQVIRKYAPAVWCQKDEPGSLFQSLIGFFIGRSWATENLLVFHGFKEVELAKRYVQFLRGLGIPKTRLKFVSFDDRERSRIRKRWKQELGLTWRHTLHVRKPTNPASPTAREWLGVRPRFAWKEGEEKKGAAYGVRFLLIMAAICADYGSSAKQQK